MSDAPEKIWATVNGASTRLPDGGRQLLGGWSEDAGRPRAVGYVRADLHAALTEERDRLKEIVDGTGLATAAIAAERDRLALANAELLADQRETLKAVLYHFGPEGAQKVTAHTLEQRKARALLDKHKATSTEGE